MRARTSKILAALLVPALWACVDEDAGPTVVTGAGALNVGMDLVAVGIPTGQVRVDFNVADLDTLNNPIDLFDRSVPSEALWDSRFSGSYDLATDYGRHSLWAPRWYKQDDNGGLRDDPRKPFLVETTLINDEYPAAMDYIRVRGPDSSLGDNCSAGDFTCWYIYHDLDVIGNDGQFVAYGLARYGVQVNGLVDHLEVWVNGVVEEPDSLVLLGGAPAGYPGNRADHWALGGDDCPALEPNANPFIMGHSRLNDAAFPGTTDPGANYDGESDAAFCFTSAGIWGDDLEGSDSPIAPNTFQSFDLPSYNYWVVWDFDEATNTVLYDRPLVRAQIGVDLDLSGNPIPHAFAPFPFALQTPWAETTGPFANRTEFLEDPRVAPGASEIELTLENLAPLSGASYQIWLFDEVDGEAVRIPAQYVRLRADTVGTDDLGQPIVEFVPEGTPESVQSFEGTAGGKHELVIHAADLKAAGIDLKTFTHVVLTVGTSGDASPLDSPAPVWFRFTDQNGTRTNFFDNEINRAGSARFGFIPALASSGTGWQVSGSANIEFLHTEAFGVRLRRLARPPLGYFYNVWLVNEGTGATQNLGPITTPAPEFASLRDADILPVDGEVLTPGQILTAWKWQEWEDVSGSFTDYTHVYVTLESKSGSEAAMSPTVLFAAPVPQDLHKVPPETPRR